MTEQESTGLNYLTDDEFRTHVRIMLEGTGHRGPQEWPLDHLDDDIYQEIERRAPLCAELRRRLDDLLEADLVRRRQADPTTADVDEYADSGRRWADPAAEREHDEVLEQWRAAAVSWLGAG